MESSSLATELFDSLPEVFHLMLLLSESFCPENLISKPLLMLQP